eukprot:4886655-Amphidinium_carterae.1
MRSQLRCFENRFNWLMWIYIAMFRASGMDTHTTPDLPCVWQVPVGYVLTPVAKTTIASGCVQHECLEASPHLTP